ncbi:HAMP domain-containing protein [Leptolyngbya cf. ectocarpi LEGE 11479]|uniref:HAMP domain-containing protein n=1 Tax=Leptolyngbya cf. ectocarpi LEGE 11479 TaxID=1828722 RepID=A0A928ZTI5_LEPEC|nr:adenylate/guanylate cyclase domain-containing protein [Leptolyngbya ectocarpi]MBE9065654.1 HAMP domain-containing protein [Leptolyngbya cf. ectocarpi LEGE 11479]
MISVYKRLLSYLSVKSKLPMLILGVSFGAISVMGYLGWHRNKITIKNDAINHLTSVRASKAHQVEHHFNVVKNKVDILAQNHMVIESMIKFKRGFKKLDQIYIPEQWDTELKTFYDQEFFPNLAKNLTTTPSYDLYQPRSQAERYLHHHYIAQNPFPIGEKYKLADAKNGSEYSEFHAEFHETLTELIQKFRFYDLLLIDYQTGDVVYSVIKETDIGTNLVNGAYQDSNLAEVVRRVQEHPEKGAVQVVDFQAYHPSYGEPVIFMAAPIYNGPHEVGILAVQLNVEQLNEITTGFKDWENDGLGRTGETFLLGADGYMRSTSRYLIEQPEKYRKALRRSGASDDTVQLVESLGTPILFQKIDNEATARALGGEDGFTIVSDPFHGDTVFASYAPLNLNGLNWVILTEMDANEIYRPLHQLQAYLLTATIIIMLLVTIVANAMTHQLLAPANRLTEALDKIGQDDGEVNIPGDSEGVFGRLGQQVNRLMARLKQTTQAVTQQKLENEKLLLNLMPLSAVKRFKDAKGGEPIVDTASQSSIVYGRLVGLAKLSQTKSVEETAHILNQLSRSFDELTHKAGIDPQNTADGTFVAVCGLSSMYLDHMERAVNLAIALMAVVHRLRSDLRGDLDLKLSVGIHTGPVIGGLVGAHQLTYKIWGETVEMAAHLCQQAQPDQILVTQPMYELLQDRYDFASVTAGGEESTWAIKF